MKKKILTVLICCFCLFLLCGCTTEVGYHFEYSPNQDGTYGITQSVDVVVDKSSVLLAGKTQEEFFELFKNLSNQAVSAYKNAFLHNCQVLKTSEDQDDVLSKIKSLTGKDWSVDDLIDYVSAGMQDVSFDSSIINPKILINDNYMYFSMAQKFDKIMAYNAFYGVIYNEYEPSNDSTIVDETFYQKKVTTQNTPFHNLTEQKIQTMANEDLLKQIVTGVENFFGNQYNLDNRDLTYTFTYSTPENHFYTDAQQIYDDLNGNTVYIWNFSSADLKKADGDKITFYTISYRTVPWYVVAVFATLILGAVLFAIAVIRGKKHKPKGVYSGANFPGENIN